MREIEIQSLKNILKNKKGLDKLLILWYNINVLKKEYKNLF